MKMFVEDSDRKIGGERKFEPLNRVLGDYFVNSFHWNKGYFCKSDFSLYFSPILTKLLVCEPVILRITASHLALTLAFLSFD